MNSPDILPWSDEEVERLLSLIQSNASKSDIAQALGRSESDLEQKARFLGVLLPEHEEKGLLTRTADSSSPNSTVRYVPFRPRRIE